MRTIEFNEEMVRNYYLSNFGRDLKEYFQHENGYRSNDILFVDRRRFDPRFSRSSGNPTGCSVENNFIFAGLFSYMVLTQQSINKICGADVQKDFRECTGWPWISAGMAGPDFPVRNMLIEAVLYPCEVEKTNYVRMLAVVKEMMDRELFDFLTEKNAANLKEDAYRRLITAVTGKVDRIMSSITEEINSLISDINETNE